MKGKQKQMKKILTYTAFFEPAEEGGYVVTIPALPGCVTQGETFEEAKKMAKNAIGLYLKILEEDGEEIPVEKDEHIEVRIPIAAEAFSDSYLSIFRFPEILFPVRERSSVFLPCPI